MFGISEFSAVINPPQACILAVGGGIKKILPPLAGGTSPRVVTMLVVKLSSDRRVIDERISGLYLQVSYIVLVKFIILCMCSMYYQ
jgi:pyruvate/2-oxoglutarate dehydrogenase complex dihydrolipoamide acyltransferase (E2) component